MPAYSCIQNWSGGGVGNINLDPLFFNGYHLQYGSPCIDAGNIFVDSGEYDLDGNPRYIDASNSSGWDGTIKGIKKNDDGSMSVSWKRIDMGAYEYQTSGPLYDTSTLQATEALDTDSWQDVYSGNKGTWTDTQTSGVNQRFYRVYGE